MGWSCLCIFFAFSPIPLAFFFLAFPQEIVLFFQRDLTLATNCHCRAKENAWTDELEAMDGFLLSGSAFRKLPQERIGHFFSKECYLYLVTQWKPIERVGGKGGLA